MEFLIGGLAAVGAGCFTNPLDVVKIRMQLQGELCSRGHHAVHYKNVVHGVYVVAKHDGLLSLQAGLTPALWYQFVLNACRLGTYDVLLNKGFTTDDKGNIVFYKTVLLGGVTGAFGAIAGSPLFLIKTHLQSKAAKEIAFGHQHNYEGTWKALTNTFSEHGIKGLFRGSSSAVPRVFVGSTAQLTSFAYCKYWLNNYDLFYRLPLLNSLVSSLVGGVAVSVMMAPFDLLSTRMYNQGVDANGRGLLYKNYGDCIVKIWKAEGVIGFYKGLGALYVRLGPHTLLNLVFWDYFKDLYYNQYLGKQQTIHIYR